MPESPVRSEEIVLRRVRNDSQNVTFADGELKVSASAFSDRTYKPSVNREELRCAKDSQIEQSDGILALITADICGLNVSQTNPTAVTYQISIQPRPIYKDNNEGEPENLSHAQIESTPALPNSNQFRKLKEGLAYLATERGEWRIKPS